MSAQQVNFYQAISLADKITIFVPPGDFDAHTLGAVYKTQLFVTDKFLILKVLSPEIKHLAIPLEFQEEIQAGKPVAISHLHPTLHYVLEQAVLDFS